jgi:hypothetical protein
MTRKELMQRLRRVRNRLVWQIEELGFSGMERRAARAIVFTSQARMRRSGTMSGGEASA